jgi:hypothetical protein
MLSNCLLLRLSWPREIPIEGEPQDMVHIVEEYTQWLSTSQVPKLFLNADPSSILTGHSENSGSMIVCAACRRRLRIVLPNGIPYYKDTSKVRKLDCPLPESLSVKAANVIYQFGDILRSFELPDNWREAIARRCSLEIEEGENTECIKHRRAELEAEQKRLVSAFTKGYMTEEDLDT